MKRQFVKFRVWNGYQWIETWAVSEKKAISNVAYRLRQCWKFPVMSMFEVERVDADRGGVVNGQV